MSTRFATYCFALIVGLTVGYQLPSKIQLWTVLVFITASILLVEGLGIQRFGKSWNDRRLAIYSGYPAWVLFVAIGLLLGSGTL